MVSNFKTSGIDLDNTFANRAWFQKTNTLFSWGNDSGDGTTIARSSPVQLSSSLAWKSISQGGGAAETKFAISTAGSLWSWGDGRLGSLGLNTTTFRSSPTQVGSLTNWNTVAAGLTGTAAIKTDGTLWTWGFNTSNSGLQLGLNDGIDRSSPVQVGALTNWSKVSVGARGQMSAIKTNGTLWTWGHNPRGSLGLNDTISRSSPVQVGALTDWSSVISTGFFWNNISIPAAATQAHTIAIKTNGTLWRWGESTSSPVQVGTDTNWKTTDAPRHAQATANGFPSGGLLLQPWFGIKTNGTLWLLSGGGNYGMLGLNDTISRSSPIQIGSLANWSDIASTTGDMLNPSVLALKSDGTLWSWGVGKNLGLNDTIARSSPVQVGTLTNWKTITTGPLAIVENNSFI
jgi:alpha-tubulin suppressor-like RCC1 family protein